MVVIILGRELLVTSIRAVAEQDGYDFSAIWFGKAKMIVQAVAIPAILVALGITEVGPATWGRTLIDLIAWTTVIVTVLSGIPYVAKGIFMFGAAHDTKP
jgi:phosphatidylglycerophosphate synthase